MCGATHMAETEKLNLFKGGLKPWIRAEVQRSRAMDLGSVISAALSLVTQESALWWGNSMPRNLSGEIGDKSMSLSRDNGGGGRASSTNDSKTQVGSERVSTYYSLAENRDRESLSSVNALEIGQSPRK